MRFVVFIILIVFSAESSKAKTLTWQETLALLATQNTHIKSSQATYQSIEALEDGTKAGYWPELSASLGYDKAMTEDIDRNQSVNSAYSAGLNLSYKLFSGFNDFSKHSQATANTRAAKQQFRLDVSGVSQEFVEAYTSLIYAQQFNQLTEKIIARRKENLNMVELRYESGRENKGSVLLSKANLKQANYEKHQAENLLQTAQSQLKKILGLEKEDSIQLSEPVPLQNPGSSVPSFDQLLLQHPASLQAFAQTESAIAGIEVAKSSFYPTLSMNGTIGRNSSSFFPDKDKWSFGLGLNIPIYSGSRDLSNLQSARFATQSKSSFAKYNDQDLLIKMRQAYNAYTEAVEKLEVDEAFTTAAQLRAEVSRNQYNNGLATFVDWDTIENDLILREKNYLQSVKDRTIKESSWYQSQGKGFIAND